MNKATGFTLIELLMVIVIAAILLVVGVPAFQEMVRNNRLVTETNALVGYINLARSEAIKRRSPVVLCSTADHTAATPACNGTAQEWDTGWILFADLSDGTLPLPPDPAAPTPNPDGDFDANTDVVIKRIPPVSATVDVRSDTAASVSLVYNGDGTLSSDSGATLALCDDRGGEAGRQITISTLGRPDTSAGTSGAPIDCTP